MRHVYDEARHNATNTLNEVNRHLRSGKIRNPRHHEILTNMMENATRTLRNIDEMDNMDRLENRRPYSDTNIGYNPYMRQRRYTYDDTGEAMRNAMDAINKILPYISDDFDVGDDIDMRQGVPGTGPYANPRLRRRGGRKGIGRRHAEMDYNMDDRYDADDRYNATYDMDDSYDMEARRGGRRRRDSRGRFARSDYDDMHYDRYNDARYDDMRSRHDHERYMNDTIARAAAETAADTVS